MRSSMILGCAVGGVIILAATAHAAPRPDLVAATNETLGLQASTIQLVQVQGALGQPVTAQVTLDGARRTLVLSPHSIRSEHYELLVQGLLDVLDLPGLQPTFAGVTDP